MTEPVRWALKMASDYEAFDISNPQSNFGDAACILAKEVKRLQKIEQAARNILDLELTEEIPSSWLTEWLELQAAFSPVLVGMRRDK